MWRKIVLLALLALPVINASADGGAGAASNAWVTVINDLNLKLKVFNPSNSFDTATFGFEYDFHKAVATRTLLDPKTNAIGLAISFNLAAQGNVAFDSTKNPEDFLKSGANFELLYTRLFNNVPDIDSDDPQLSQPLLYTRVKANGALESNQTFSKKQWAYGASVGGNLLDAGSKTTLSRWNILDYPFAALRYLTRADEKWSPSGDSFPVLLAGIDLIDPITDAERFAIDPSKDPYPRFSAEVTFKTQAATLAGHDIFLGAAYRYFKEISPSPAIRAANFDEQQYFVVYVEFLSGFSVSYSTGKLPLDRKDDQVFALGYRLNF